MIGFAIIALAVTATPASALATCERVTHATRGGEARHVDHGGGHVSYVEWWSNEGVYSDMVVMRCEDGQFLRARTQEERISDRWFDRRAEASHIIETELQSAPSLFSFATLERSLNGVGRDIEIATAARETCACAAAYPELRGDKAPYEASE